MTRPEKLTPANLRLHLIQTAHEHRDFGWLMFTLLYDLKINDTAAGKIFNVHPRTFKHWRSVEQQRRGKKRDKDDKAVDEMRGL